MISTKRRQFLIAGIIAIVAVSVAIVLFFKYKGEKERSVGEVNYPMFITTAHNFYNSFNPDVMVYGEEFDYSEHMKVRKITSICLEEFEKETKPYKALILMDRFGGMAITDEEILFIKKYCQENKMDMYYFGTEKLSDFCRLGMTEGFKDNELSFAYLGTQKSSFGIEAQNEKMRDYSYACHGMFLKEDGDLSDDKTILCCLLWLMDFSANDALTIEN